MTFFPIFIPVAGGGLNRYWQFTLSLFGGVLFMALFSLMMILDCYFCMGEVIVTFHKVTMGLAVFLAMLTYILWRLDK